MLRPDGGEFRFPEGETGDEFRKRIGAALGELRRKHPEGRVALVCHAGVCGAILAEAMGLSNAAMWSVVQDFGCLNVIDFFEGGGSRVRLVNGYLGPEGYRWPGPGRDRLALAPNK
jgi:alpha-ribazole phosphatase/probable phosphoglycerate mutase